MVESVVDSMATDHGVTDVGRISTLYFSAGANPAVVHCEGEVRSRAEAVVSVSGLQMGIEVPVPRMQKRR